MQPEASIESPSCCGTSTTVPFGGRLAGITKNPTNNIPLLEENNKKERFLSKEEAEKLLGAIKKSPNKMLQYIVPMLILTGARKNEVHQRQVGRFQLRTEGLAHTYE